VAHHEMNFSNWQASWLSTEEQRTEDRFEEIVGNTPALRRMLKLAMKVARSDAPVLILGATGSGKELIARAIHRTSARKNESFVKVSFTLVPSAPGGLETALFGQDATHDKSRKIGQIELANQGTLFLDEIAHLSLDLQTKILRLLERQEIGAGRNAINVRLIATTEYDLGERVARETFLGDLYDQLNLFPIQVPALCERRDDIPLLARYFMQKFARRQKKNVETIPAEIISFLTNFDWPGNVRQLENLIERSVILTEGSALQVPSAGLRLDHDAEPV
jgi:formate hydrogenlyase transcriptional activator